MKAVTKKIPITLLLIALLIAFLHAQDNAALPDTAAASSSSLGEQIKDVGTEIEWEITFGKIFWSLIIFLLAFFAVKYLTRLLDALGEHWTSFRLAIKRIIPILRISVWTFVIYIIIIGIFAPPIETLIAVTASAGIAVGFASQDILKNIFGGIMILFDRPFQVGDKIQVAQHYGEVKQIGLRTVRIVTPDDSEVSIPNGELVNQSVSNANSGAFNCQVVAEFFLPPHIDLARLKKIAYRAAAVSRYVYLGKPIVVLVKNEIHEGRSLLKMRLKAYVYDLRYEFAFASEMTELVMGQLFREGLINENSMSPVYRINNEQV